MKKIVAILLSISMSFGQAFGSSESDRYVKIFADVYLREQIKEHLRVYINAHPAVVGSVSKKAGTSTIKYVSQILSAYNFIVAKSDIDKAFAAAQIFNPEPTTAIIIFAAQIAATVAELKLQKSLARRYAEIAKVNAKASSLLKRFGVAEAKRQLDWIQDAQTRLNVVSQIESLLIGNPMYKAMSGEDCVVTPENVEKEISTLFELEAAYSALAESIRFLDFVEIEKLGLPLETKSSWVKIKTATLSNIVSLAKLESAFKQIFVSVHAKSMMENQSSSIDEEIEMKVFCEEALSSSRLIEKYPDINLVRRSNEELNQCRQILLRIEP